jgi:ATP-dependent Clp protease ATP-binding subunit ClpA
MIKRAHDLAKKKGNPSVDPEHLLVGLLGMEDSLAYMALERLQVDMPKLCGEVESLIPAGEGIPQRIEFSANAKLILESAWTASRFMRHKHIGCEHFLIALLWESDSRIAQILDEHGVTADALKATILGIHRMGIEYGEKLRTKDQYTADRPTEDLPITTESEVLLKKAFGEARISGQKGLRPEHILMALLKLPELDAGKFLQSCGVSIELFKSYLDSLKSKEKPDEPNP